jgi:2-amino-4-hydroxy-6-hydroxymethyldihydropteridine diphosphokinase
LYGDACIASSDLTVPHPRMWERAFVIVPLAEIASESVPHKVAAQVSDQPIEKLGNRG